jgi:hypothetical protein
MSQQPEVVIEDLDSQKAIGVFEKSVSTELAKEADARLVAQRYVAFGTRPGWMIPEATVDLSLDTVDVALALALLDLRISDLVELPRTNVSLGMREAFVEGWEDSYDAGSFTIRFALSSFHLTRPATRWIDVPVAHRWVDVDPALTWTASAATAP